MKTINKIATGLLVLVTFMGYSQNDVKLEGDNLTEVFNAYIGVKNALVQSQTVETQANAKLLLATLNDSQSELRSVVEELVSAQAIEIQRKAFSNVTNKMQSLIENKVTAGVVYKQYCPMALNDGAYWFSVDKNIENPYYGDKMLRCGKVAEKLQ